MADAGRERELLLCCSRTHVDAAVGERIASLLGSGPDWERVMRLSHTHQVTPLVAGTLCGQFASLCPRPVIDRMRTTARAIALRGMVLSQKLVEVVDVFDAEAIPLIAYKGPLLALIAYDQRGLRQFGDLDIWVHRWDYHRSVPEILARSGWTPFADYYHERSFRHADGDVVLDVHRWLTPQRMMPFSPSFVAMLGRGADVEVAGRRVRTLDPRDLVIVLCVQLAKDVIDDHTPPLIKVCDIAELVRRHRDLDWTATMREARRLGVRNVVCLGLMVARRLLGSPVPAEFEAACANFPGLGSLARHVEERIFDEGAGPYSRPELLEPAAWNAALRERYRDRTSAIIALTRFVLVPNEYDYAFVRLPKRLDRLYEVARPVRLFAKHAHALAVTRRDANVGS